jgi:ribonuclease HI
MVLLQVDGTPGAQRRGIAGLGMVVRDRSGQVLIWHCGRAPAYTSNEAEYQAVIMGLAVMLRHYPDASVRCLSDSRVIVEQMCGRAAVRAASLQPLYAQATALARQFSHIEFIAIPRDLNRLADALAWEALGGRLWIKLNGTSSSLTDH